MKKLLNDPLRRKLRPMVLLCLLLFSLWPTPHPVLAASQTDITGPTGSGAFGGMLVLPNGNIVVADPLYDIPSGAANVGAVYLYNGATRALISTLIGSTANDFVGNSGVIVLSNGNYVVISTSWDNGAVADVGAVTWASGSSGVSGVVSSSNSLIGSTASDGVGSNGVTALSNGNYVVRSLSWDNGAATDAGAVTWGNGSSGVSGVVNSSNSLVGSTASDQVGTSVTALSNGNYVVNSYPWDNGTVVDAGAVTWGNGNSGVSGAVSSSNSLVGSTANDQVGAGGGITVLSNGNYVVGSTNWDNGAATNAGAVTWGSGSSGVSGVVSSSNSLVGSTASDNVGTGVTALSNGNYVVRSPNWDNGAVVDAGAVTWGNGSSGVSGVVSSSNSLVGSTATNQVGSYGVTALSNGNYVVSSGNWDNGAVADAGAVTWGNGSSGVSGVVSSSNSLVGSTASDSVGTGVTALSNGNYVVRSPNWDNGAVANVGAVTWGSGSSGVSGAVSSSNSLVGGTASDFVGFDGVTALSNGNYVVRSSAWDNGAATDAGAATWGNGSSGISGVVSSSNSLVGSKTSDNVGSTGVTALSNGNYVVISQVWSNGAVLFVGAATWGNGSSGTSGVVSSSNSLVGSTANDFVGNSGVIVLSNGNYVVRSRNWDNGAVANAGAVTWGNGSSGVSGTISSSNSLVGSTNNDQVGVSGATALSNGNYVVKSNNWDNGAATNAGAVTWGNGSSGTSGVVSSSNSLVGSKTNDNVGSGVMTALSNGNYVVWSPSWDNGAVADVGAVTWGHGSSGVTGSINSSNSVLGTAASGGGVMLYAFDSNNQQLVVGRSADNKVTLFRLAGDVTSAIGKLRTASVWTSGAGAYSTIGYYNLAYNFTNNGSTSRSDVYYEVTVADKAYLLDQNAGTAGGAVGAKKTVNNGTLPGGNNLWDASETLSNQQFQIGVTGSGWKLTLSIFAIDNTVRQKAQVLGTIELSGDDLPAANQVLYLPVVQR